MQQLNNRVIVFSSPNSVKDEASIVKLILQKKIKAFHLRKPSLSIEETRFFLNRIPKVYHSKIVIHNYISLLQEYQLKGYYCTRIFLKSNEIETIKKKYPKFSFSKGCHSIKELKNIEAYDYVFLSPIFDSISKKDLSSNFNLKQLEEHLQKEQKPIYALGGITPSLSRKLENINFKGIGVLGFIWSNNNPIQQLDKFLN